jgi:Polyketide cyclase / dehydrase and lipid transport
MSQVFTSTVVGAPVGEVWALLRDFAAIGNWHPALPPCKIENGPADRVGCVRVFPLAGGHRETLVSLDDKRRSIAFTFGDNAAGLPVRRYLSTMSAQPVTLSDHTYVEWVSRFDCDETDEDAVISQVRDGVLIPGLKALEQRFGPAVTAMEATPMAAGTG